MKSYGEASASKSGSRSITFSEIYRPAYARAVGARDYAALLQVHEEIYLAAVVEKIYISLELKKDIVLLVAKVKL